MAWRSTRHLEIAITSSQSSKKTLLSIATDLVMLALVRLLDVSTMVANAEERLLSGAKCKTGAWPDPDDEKLSSQELSVGCSGLIESDSVRRCNLSTHQCEVRSIMIALQCTDSQTDLLWTVLWNKMSLFMFIILLKKHEQTDDKTICGCMSLESVKPVNIFLWRTSTDTVFWRSEMSSLALRQKTVCVSSTKICYWTSAKQYVKLQVELSESEKRSAISSKQPQCSSFHVSVSAGNSPATAKITLKSCRQMYFIDCSIVAGHKHS